MKDGINARFVVAAKFSDDDGSLSPEFYIITKPGYDLPGMKRDHPGRYFNWTDDDVNIGVASATKFDSYEVALRWANYAYKNTSAASIEIREVSADDSQRAS